MSAKPGLFSGAGLRRLFSGDRVELERRVLDLPVAIERRGPRCASCGFGTVHAIPSDLPNSGRMRCDRVGCGALCDAVAEPGFTLQPAFARG